jgi:hypothetical protein
MYTNPVTGALSPDFIPGAIAANPNIVAPQGGGMFGGNATLTIQNQTENDIGMDTGGFKALQVKLQNSGGF